MTSDSALRPHSPTGLDTAAWHLASSLAERAERTALGRPATSVDAERGRRRLQSWKEEKCYTCTPEQLERWLGSLGLDESELVGLFGETRESLAARFTRTPEYVRTIERAWTVGHPAGHPSGHGFLTLVAPLIDDGRRRIRAALTELLAEHPTPHVTYEKLAEQLCLPPAMLSGVLSRTLVLELNVLRVQGGLDGATPEDRFQHFLRKLADPGYALGLLSDYPVLARDLVRIVDNWVRTRVEFAGHLLTDLPELLTCLGAPDALGAVTEVVFNAGDSHRGGRSVGIVHFADGRKVVYKPRSLAVDVHFQELLRRLNGLGVRPELRTLWVLDRTGHGWTEFAATRGCANREGVARFYRRQGAHLALLHCLAATDFHYENVIASGEHPMLVDLEALFHPRTSERKLPAWDEQGTDHMHLVRRRVETHGGQNLPSLTQDTVTVLDFQDELVAGFQETYRLLLAHRDALLAPGGPIDAFAADSVRVVLRSTQTYARILRDGHHPDLLRDGLDRDRLFSLLWGEDHSPVRDAAVATAELDQLSAGDIPVFTATADSLDLVSGDGTVIPAALEQSGMDRARRRIRAMSEENLVQQTWFLEASLTALTMGDDMSETHAGSPDHGLAPGSAPATEDALIAAAHRTGGEKVRHVGPASMDLYNGIAGISLFLAHLGELERLGDGDETTVRLLGMGARAALGGSLYTLSHLGALWNRPDLLDGAAPDVVAGSAGAVLAGLALYSVRPDATTLGAVTGRGAYTGLVREALRFERASYDPAADHWPDGDPGNLEALQLAATVPADIERRGPVCGVPRGVERSGLMAGLAGIGYSLLRLARPDAVPSVLLCEGPK